MLPLLLSVTSCVITATVPIAGFDATSASPHYSFAKNPQIILDVTYDEVMTLAIHFLSLSLYLSLSLSLSLFLSLFLFLFLSLFLHLSLSLNGSFVQSLTLYRDAIRRYQCHDG